jgi:hypothetical protein
LRRSHIALIALASGIVVNFLVVLGIFAAQCDPSPIVVKKDENPPPAFGSMSHCDQARPVGFVILGLADAFFAALMASELSKRGRPALV